MAEYLYDQTWERERQRLGALERLFDPATAGQVPILIRVETKAGHGAGKPVSKMIEEDADIFTFLFKALEMESDG